MTVTTTPQAKFPQRQKRRLMVLLPTAKERGRCKRLAKQSYWSSLSKAQSDIQQRLKVFTPLQE
jgi:hypothetical protein